MSGELKIRNRLRRLRFDHGEMTQQALAEKVDVARQTILSIELERYAPSLELAFRLADVFKVGLEEVFYRDRQSPERPDTDEA